MTARPLAAASRGTLLLAIFVAPAAALGADTDSDGMEDSWETSYFGDLSRDGTGDFDSDGMTDLEEHDEGFIPDVHDGFDDHDGDRYPSVFELRNGADPNDGGDTPSPTYVVDWSGGGDYTTISAAVNAATGGSSTYRIIEVAPGTYTGSSNTAIYNPSSDPHFLIIGQAGAASTFIDGEYAANNGKWDLRVSGVISSLTFLRYSQTPVEVRTNTAPIRFDDVVFRDNAGSAGGAIWVVSASRADFIHCTFLENRATTTGPDHIWAWEDIVLRNTVIWDTNNDTPISYVTASLDAEYSLVVGETLVGTGNLSGSTNPGLLSDARVSSGSSAVVGAGSTGLFSAIDMDGETRSGTTPTIGADEWVDSDADGLADSFELASVGDLTTLTGVSQDYDSDGLDNEAEYNAGTDPDDSDSDDDGLSDGAEVNTYGSNPLDTDSDDDGMSDQYEATHGLLIATSDRWHDADGDRYPNYLEFLASTSPSSTTAYPSADYVVDEVQGGMSGADSIYETFEEAFTQAESDGGSYRVILVKPGVYTGSANTGVEVSDTAPLLLVIGEGGAASTVIDGEHVRPGWKFERQVLLESLTFRRMNQISLWLYDADESLLSNILSHENTAYTYGSTGDMGGGMTLHYSENVSVVNSTFLNNQGIGGGQAATHFKGAGSSVTISNSVFASFDSDILFYGFTSSTLSGDYSLVEGYTLAGTNNLASTTDSGLRSDGRLLPTSALVGAGGGRGNDAPDFDLEQRPSSDPDIGVDFWVDSDADGLPDGWEMETAGNLTTLSGSGDADSDGMTDLAEYQTTAYGAVADPLNEDSDGDGIRDGDEGTLGRDPLVPDAIDVEGDNNDDGLDDSVGLALGIDPFNTDSDGDGLSNTYERSRGLDPLNADTDGDGYDDDVDDFPFDPYLHELTSVMGDTTAPTITLERPADAVLQ